GMREFKYHFIYELIVADGPGDGGHLRIGRHLGNETRGVKLTEFIPANTAGQHWNVVDISVLDHGGERLLVVASVELMTHMLLPELLQSFLGGREMCVWLRFLLVLHDSLLLEHHLSLPAITVTSRIK